MESNESSDDLPEAISFKNANVIANNINKNQKQILEEKER